MAALTTTLFLGGWWFFGLENFIPPWLLFIAKIYLFYFVFIWTRGTLPRLRIDQLMGFAWKVMVPMALVNLFLAATERIIWVEWFDLEVVRVMPAGQVAAFVGLSDTRGAVLLAVRLRVVERQITEVETIVARDGEATFFSPRGLTHDPIYDEPLSAADAAPRQELADVADLYFQGLSEGDGSGVPFDARASRNENGIVTASGSSLSNLRAFSYIDEIKRRYVLVDEERGVVLPFVLFEIPSGLTGSRTLHLAEVFKVAGGTIRQIHAIMVNQPLGTPSGWE